MKILITGANGFIGSYCMEYFNNLGYDVTGLVRRIPENSKFQYVIHDLREELKLKNDFDVIIHAASELDKTQKKMEVYVKGNIIGTQNLIKYAENHALALINLSSVRSFGTFGTVEDSIISENTTICNPEYYGITKYISEKLVLESNIETISLILPGIIGKNGHTPWLMHVARSMMVEKTIECYDPNKLFNNVLHVDTLAECIHRIIKQNIYNNERILLGSRNPMSKYSLLIELRRLLKSNSCIHIVEGNYNSFSLDITKAEERGLVLNDVRGELIKLAEDLLLR